MCVKAEYIQTMFEDIRPYRDDEVREVIGELLNDPGFLSFVANWKLPRLDRQVSWLATSLVAIYLKRHLGKVRTVREFQEVVAQVVSRIVDDTTDGFICEGLAGLDSDQSYVFVSNHRDIAGDSMLLDYALYGADRDTVRIAVGDNLVQVGFATHLMKLNRSFFIKRSEQGPKRIYAALLQSSQYIHESLQDGHSIWIAQSEGRAKDGMDVTEPAVIKMLALAKRKADFSEVIEGLNIVPMSISYEFDPCDASKAMALSAVDSGGAYSKPEGEDLVDLIHGLNGYKGRVVLRLGSPIRGHYSDAESVAAEVDRQVRSGLELFPINYWALAQLGITSSDNPYPKGSVDTAQFQERLLACPEEARHHWLTMYANPVLNKSQS